MNLIIFLWHLTQVFRKNDLVTRTLTEFVAPLRRLTPSDAELVVLKAIITMNPGMQRLMPKTFSFDVVIFELKCIFFKLNKTDNQPPKNSIKRFFIKEQSQTTSSAVTDAPGLSKLAVQVVNHTRELLQELLFKSLKKSRPKINFPSAQFGNYLLLLPILKVSSF